MPSYFSMVCYICMAFSSLISGSLGQSNTVRTCGTPDIPPKSSQTRVKGGQEAIAGSWPWQIRLGIRSGNGARWICGGSILTEIYVITAAHCVEGGQNQAFVVRVGDHNQGMAEPGEQVHAVLRTRIHSHYGGQGSSYANDIAILRLATPITFKKTVSPACIPQAMEEVAHGTNCYVTGWGNLGPNSGGPAKLQQGNVQIVGPQACSAGWGNLRASQVCAGTSNGVTDACKGDSGGPLVCRIPNTNKWVMHGLVSFGPLSGCGLARQPAVYTKVSHFVRWIQETTSNTALSATSKLGDSVMPGNGTDADPLSFDPL